MPPMATVNQSITVPSPEAIKVRIEARRAEVRELQKLYKLATSARRALSTPEPNQRVESEDANVR
jgi:lipopolysaccharide export system protein LptC